MVKATRLGFVPSEEQRAFVAAATAVGLSPVVICRMLPRDESGKRAVLTPQGLARHFAEELDPDAMLAARLVALRVLQRALGSDEGSAASAQLAVFKTLQDWRSLGDASAAAQRLAVERLSRAERDTLRQLLDKAAECEG
ncbi:MAG TPA: hypothetical protein VMF12_19505 [Xanthobacteraceae bacterium]|nr:hypothetical protein [Xanthobacteraceae bacterium]HUC64602.1 hypothetical protein [Stellaceae bacterium]